MHNHLPTFRWINLVNCRKIITDNVKMIIIFQTNVIGFDKSLLFFG